ncbi:hypothetical protein AALP_AAs49847U000100 [Arabis alpina]|uniref:RNA-directed DNA polymerase n=1 Tax=Arabis alpina TaxID=50452 RepID=A0A087G3P1_ARAAL|nr:hypothetical protein AALP_AAs49847U000100 [Arabis alpina]
MVSGEENTSHRDNQEREPPIEATATKNPAHGDLTDVKKMLEDFLTEQKKQAKMIEENSKARVDPQRLDFSAPRTTRENTEDLPPPPPRRETNKSPERVVDLSDGEEPAPAKRTRTEGPEGNRQEPRAPDTQNASSFSKTEIVGDTAEYSDYSSEKRYKKEQERRAFKRSYAAELAAVKAQMDRVTSDLKYIQSQMHQGTGKDPAIAQVLEKARNTPFGERVAKTKISNPGRIKLPIYKGTTDPSDHLMEFEVALGRANFKETETDIVYCKLFVESLKGPALQWFYKMEKNSVHTFLQLSELFVQHYNIFTERKIYDSELWNNKQGENESLRSFMTRFKNTLSKVEGISNKSALEALRGALRCPSPFWQEISLNTPITIQDALHRAADRAADFARTEEEVQARKGGKTKQANEPTKVAAPKRNNPTYVEFEGGSGGAHNYQVDSSDRGRGRGRRRGRGRGTWNNSWTRESKDYDEKLYCDFHKSSGHSTARCRELGRNLIAKLTEGTLKNNNSLSDFKPVEKAPTETEQEVDTPRRHRRNDGVENGEQREVINMIMGGSQYCADEETAIEAYQLRADVCANISAPAKPRLSSDSITFDEKDTEGLDQPHNDPLVINLTIYDFNIARVLIDTGSSVDVIFRKTLERLKIDLSTIKGRPKPITGFSGETTMTMGTIRLPVQASNVKHMVDFTISDHPAIYNIAEGRVEEERPTCEPVISVCIDEQHPERCVEIGATLDEDLKKELVAFLRKNINTFAWAAEDMPGIDINVTSHELNVDPTFKPIKQKRRKLGPERAKAVNDEVERLLRVGSITEVKYPDWLANPVVVKKQNGKWRVCVDFTDLNKACPKDSFPLPHIDRLVEATAGNKLLTFMDAFSGYNQILMHPEDREKTAFITDRGCYCNKVMPFGLKNAGATYQRLVNKMFQDQLGKTMEVYIDDMLVKSLEEKDHISHLEACFNQLNLYDMKLNPTKCRFVVTSGEFLGYLVTHHGIEANSKQIDALIQMASPRNKREVQRLTGRVAALNRFVSRSTDKCLPFYNTLRGNKQFEWSDKCEDAFRQLKEYLATPPILAKPITGEPLFLYIAISETAVSAVAETRYPQLEKLALSTVMASRKLRPYFQVHTIVVLSTFPLRSVLHSPSQSGRLAKWAIELSEYDIEYRGRTCNKSQVLADFLIELPEDQMLKEVRPGVWELHVDGSSSKNGSGVGIRLASPTGEILEQSFRLGFKASNNEAEYEAIIAGMRLAQGLNIEHVHAFCDSQLVTSRFSGEYETKDDRMEAYRVIPVEFIEFPSIQQGTSLAISTRSQTARQEKAIAESLETSPKDMEMIEAAEETEPTHPPMTTPMTDAENTQDADNPSLKDHDQDASVPMETDEEPEYGCDKPWMDQIRAYIVSGELPNNKWAARKLQKQAARYVLLDENIYRCGFSGPLLTCVEGQEARQVMEEVHSGSCGNHSGGKALAIKIKRHGHFWPTIVNDCIKFSAKCERCQRHAPKIHQPTEKLSCVTSPYPFMRWAMDIVGPLHASKQKRFLLLLTDYFSKWVEAEAYSSIKDAQVESFVWRNIICRHGIPFEIITDNGSQFISNRFEAFCAKWKIRLNKSTPRHPQGNGQAEAMNKTILDGLKKRLDAKKGRWADELEGVLWSHRTTPKRGMGETPFALVYGTECVIPSEITSPGPRRRLLTEHEDLNDSLLFDELDFLNETRSQALIKIANYQNVAARYYNSKV